MVCGHNDTIGSAPADSSVSLLRRRDYGSTSRGPVGPGKGMVHARNQYPPPVLRLITKDAVVEYYGSPAVKSTKQKLDPDLPIKHWWITAPVARAIDLAGRLSQHEHLAFASVTSRWAGDGFTSIAAIDDFINHINRWRHISGLEQVPEGNVTPHMFRRTMAMLTQDFPGSEIAVGMQLKHVTTRALANRPSPPSGNRPSSCALLDKLNGATSASSTTCCAALGSPSASAN
jgi:hypothetical protein